jgi:acetylornithine deacetylase/succinyl-diaminopimelate desuccinylase-like protein
MVIRLARALSLPSLLPGLPIADSELYKPGTMSAIDWNAVEKEVTGLLQDLIRFDTTNPPGNETLCANYIADILKREGFETDVTESEPGRGNVVARIGGGGEETLMLLGHADVVAAEPEHWTYPPFSGERVGNHIWGRGTLDMKGMVAVELMIFLMIHRQGLKLNRDLVYAATADEEAGKGNHGVGWLIDHHPDQVEAKYVLTEGGGADIRIGNASFFTVQTGQKGIFRFRLHAKGRPGHGSVPHNENAVVRLAQSIARLGEAKLPIHPSPTFRAYLEGIAESQDSETAENLLGILDPERSEMSLVRSPFDEDTIASLGSLLRNTVSPTMLNAGSKINVIPGEAVAWVDGRLAPGQTKESFLEEIGHLLADGVTIEVDQYSPPIEASIESPLYQTIVEVVKTFEPHARVIPSLMTGGTDAKHILPRRPDTMVYGFMPMKQAPGEEEGALIHGHDERVTIDNLMFATRMLYDVVVKFCTNQRGAG